MSRAMTMEGTLKAKGLQRRETETVMGQDKQHLLSGELAAST